MRLSLINKINSITSVDWTLFAPNDNRRQQAPMRPYCGPAVKTFALNMVGRVARNLPRLYARISWGGGGVSGGVTTWRRGRVSRTWGGERAGLYRRDDLWL